MPNTAHSLKKTFPKSALNGEKRSFKEADDSFELCETSTSKKPKFSELEQSFLAEIKVQLKKLDALDDIKAVLKSNSESIEYLHSSNITLQNKVKTLRIQNERLDAQLRKQNVIVFGLTEVEKQTNLELVMQVDNFFESKLRLPNIEIDTVHRLGKSAPNLTRPVKVRFVKLRDKERVIANRKSLAPPHYINDDLPNDTRMDHALLRQTSADAIKKGHSTKILWGTKKIIVDQQSFEIRDGKVVPSDAMETDAAHTSSKPF